MVCSEDDIVLQGLAEARINALEILDMPDASAMAAKEDLLNAEEARLARNEMMGIPRNAPPADNIRAVPVAIV